MIGDRPLAVRVLAFQSITDVVCLFRGLTDLPVGRISHAVKAATPIAIVEQWTACDSHCRRQVLEALDRLASIGCSFETLLADEVVSRKFLRNQLALRQFIEEEGRMISDLESDEPTEEALEWHRRNLGTPEER